MTLKTDLAIELNQLEFRWPNDHRFALSIDHLAINKGEQLFLQGPSGCGKSTLLGLLTGMHRPTQGQVRLLNVELTKLNESQRDQFRANHIGYIYQQFNLIPYLSLVDNVVLPCRFSPQRTARCLPSPVVQAQQLLTDLGLDSALWDKPAHRLSIGQQQRVAAARALIGAPEIIIADEPTSALDHDHRQRFIDLLLRHTRAQGSTVVFVSHDPTLADYFDRKVQLTELNRVLQP
ncbi:ABC transporter ATP-binding protein [Vibrio sp. SM6]|uniref:ABC transporter ATP-binding protein n=1 Tax=Vibrio agarilyticus TaxID=2726741 RepID=A0A7X8TPA6_9VIBR|nr:ABC transporter ATP-binding protein [Vibrio agarilyticus]NLS12425.1 ABC transporter ATP-binding protein [Vibrio agarilyticus]